MSALQSYIFAVYMRVIGITGGVGSGKSSVLKLLKERFNAYILIADDIAKETMCRGNAGYEQVVEMFSEDILDKNSTQLIDEYYI